MQDKNIETYKDIQKEINKLLQEAMHDENLKKQLLTNPRQVLEERLNTRFPVGADFKVLENTVTTSYFVLPYLKQDQMDAFETRTQNLPKPEQCIFSIMAKSLKDQTFKQRLMDQPKEVLEECCGMSFPANIQFKVVEDTETTTHLVLPFASSDELTDQELAAVSGGFIFILAGAMVVAAALPIIDEIVRAAGGSSIIPVAKSGPRPQDM